MYVLIAIFLIVLDLLSFCLPFLFSCLVIWWLSLVVYLDCFYLFMCVYIVGFWYTVPPKFWYSSLYTHKFFWGCWTLNFKLISNGLHLYSPHDTDFDVIFECGWFLDFTLFLSLLVHFPIHNFILGSSCCISFPNRKVPLAFVVKLVWWCWVLLAFACL